MANTLEIPAVSPGAGTIRDQPVAWTDTDIDAIINRMVHQESGGDPNAVGKKGEIGLVQIMPKTAAQYGVSPEMLRNPIVNRWVARRYLTDLLAKYKGNMNLAVEAYNAGPGRVDKSLKGQASIPSSTQAYLRTATSGFTGGPVSPGNPAFERPRRDRVPTIQIGNRRYDADQLNQAVLGIVGGPDADVTDIPADFIEQLRYHGSKEGPLNNLRPGPFYTSTDKELARGYGNLGARLGEKSKGQLYQVFQRAGVKFLDMEKPLPPEIVNDIIVRNPDLARFRRSYLTQPARQFIAGGFTPKPYDISTILDEIVTKRGYGGYQELPHYPSSHLGGSVMPGAKQEKLYLKPHEDIRLRPTSKLENILGKMLGEGTAYADEGVPVDKLSPADRLAIAKLPKPSPTATPKQEPFGARAASWLPTIGQGVGEFAGATGGAMIPGLGETGVPEYLGGVTGGALGSAGGAAIENQIRKAYGLPPVSVGKEAAWGAAGSAVGPLIVPGFQRARKAFSVIRGTGEGFGKATEEVAQRGAELEGTVGTGARKAEMLSEAPSNPIQEAYQATRAAQLKPIGDAVNDLYRPYGFKLTPNNVKNVLAGPVGKRLELAGKPLRQALEDEINAAPMTVNRARVILSNLKAQMRQLNPNQNAAALRAYGDVEKALEGDIDAVIGPAGAARRKMLDQMFARKLDEYPIIPYSRAMTEPQIAAEILDKGKVPVTVIEQMKAGGKIADLRRAVSVRLFKQARDAAGGNPGAELKALQAAVEKIKPDVFDALYGKGAQKEWMRMATDTGTKYKDLLKHPDEATAIKKAVESYLAKGNNLARLKQYLMYHRIPITVLMLMSGEMGGVKMVGIELGGLLGLGVYAGIASPVARGLIWTAMRTKDGGATARLIIAGINAAIRAEGEHVAGSK